MTSNEKRLSLAFIHYPNQKNQSQDSEQIQGKKWLKFLHEPLTSINTEKNSIALGDFNGDGENKLVLVDTSNEQCRLKLFRGLTLITDTFLSEQPSGIVTFTSEGGNIPCIAVAINSSILIYRNMKPYYRYNVESMDINSTEINLWNAAKNQKINQDELFNGLQNIKNENLLNMSFVSQYYLTINSSEERITILTKLLNEKLNLTNILINCITTIKKNLTDDNSPDVIVIGTESCSLYWIDTTAFNVLGHCKISLIPDKIITMGEFDLESRYIIATREGDIVTLKKNSQHKFSQNVINIKDYVKTMTTTLNNIIVSTKSDKLLFFTKKMKKLTEIQFDETIIDLETFHYEQKLYSGVLVAFNNHIDLYIDGILMDILNIDNVNWIKYGKFGREDSVLIIGHQNEGITVMSFKRTAVLTEISKSSSTQLSKLQPPKVSRLFVEKTLKERQDPKKVHVTTQRDYFMLKLNLTKSYAELVTKDKGMVPTKETEKLQINSEINGFGPNFRITITVISSEDLSNEKRYIAFSYDRLEYSMEYQLIPMTKIIKNYPTIYSNGVVCLHPEKGLQSEIKIFILSENKKQPLWMTKFDMPISEQSIV